MSPISESSTACANCGQPLIGPYCHACGHYRLRNEGSHLAFLLVPISLPCISLMFVRRRDVCAYDHAIVALD